MVPLKLGSDDEFRAARKVLAEAAYNEGAICSLYNVPSVYDLGQNQNPTHQGAAKLALLVEIFLQGRSKAWTTVRSILTSADAERMQVLGLLTPDPSDDSRCIASVILSPIGSVLLASDRWHPEHQRLPEDLVFPAITPQTRQFLRFLPSHPCERLLDLGTGTGVAGFTAATHYAQRVWACDIAPRSIHFAEFNRRLNNLSNAVVLEGDVYNPVDGETFDRIVTHPPYIPSTTQRYLFRDGGDDGEQITQRILAGLHTFLRPGGQCYCATMISDREGAPAEQRVRRMLGEAEAEFDVLVVAERAHTPSEFCAQYALDGYASFDAARSLQTLCREKRIKRLVPCVVAVQRRATPARQTLTLRRQAGERTTGHEIEWLLRWESQSGEPGAAQPDWLAALRPRANPRLRLQQEHHLQAGRWIGHECAIETDYPFAARAQCPAWSARLIAGCDGEATLGTHFESLRQDGALPGQASLEGFLQFARAFTSAGFLEIEQFSWPDATLEGLSKSTAARATPPV